MSGPILADIFMCSPFIYSFIINMISTLTDVLKASHLSDGQLQLYTLSDDDIIKLLDGAKANLAILIFIVIWLIKLLT